MLEITILRSSIGSTAVSFRLTAADGYLDIDIVARKSRFSRPAMTEAPNPFRGQPGAANAACALKVLIHRYDKFAKLWVGMGCEGLCVRGWHSTSIPASVEV